MDEFLTFLYSEYFNAKDAVDEWAANRAMPSDQVELYREREQSDKRALASAEIRLRKYMRISFAEIKRLPSG